MKYSSAKGQLAPLVLGALGVVFGDIGTSPLYAFRQCVNSLHEHPLSSVSILGILSLIVWSIIFVVCIKYLTFIMRAEHDGEGGILAMLALIQTKRMRSQRGRLNGIVIMVLLGAALLYGDGVITPAISVLSAVEGLKIAVPATQAFIVPISLIILIALFLFQAKGTGEVGALFGPIMTLWFMSIAVIGIQGILQAPQVLEAFNPLFALKFLAQHGWKGLMVLGGVVLCFSGAEALFADLSHFGRKSIEIGWYGLVFPALMLNYFGQGGLLMGHPEFIQKPFFALVSAHWLLAMVILATAATIIASQALISGSFTLTEQAIHMGYFPPFEITRTSQDQQGQLYVGTVNYLLMIACIIIVLVFRSSENLGSAYGLAVIGTMIITSLTFFIVLRQVWRWSKIKALTLVGLFLCVDLSFLIGNIVKIFLGAWIPLVFAVIVFAVFWVWSTVHARFHRALDKWAMPLKNFHHEMRGWKKRSLGTAVFLTNRHDSVPLIGKNLWLREHVRPEKVILITVREESIPYVTEEKMVVIKELDPGFWQVTAAFGFMQHPDVTRVLRVLEKRKYKIDWEHLVCYLPEPITIVKHGWWQHLLHKIYHFLKCNSLSPTLYFRIPPREVILVGVRLEI